MFFAALDIPLSSAITIKGPLIVIAEDKGIMNSAKNISGVDCCLAKNLNAELLAPGTYAGRLTIYTESAIKKLGEIYG